MVDESFNEVIRSNKGCAVICAGSDSDAKQMEEVSRSLEQYQIPYEVRICSAHKQCVELMSLIEAYNEAGGGVVYVAIAGGTDALSGILSYHALGPVISCPPDPPNASCLHNPPGSSNATIFQPKNVGRFVAQVFAGVNSRLRQQLSEEKARKRRSLEEADRRFRRYKGEP